jgi:hypothetical protein
MFMACPLNHAVWGPYRWQDKTNTDAIDRINRISQDQQDYNLTTRDPLLTAVKWTGLTGFKQNIPSCLRRGGA